MCFPDCLIISMYLYVLISHQSPGICFPDFHPNNSGSGQATQMFMRANVWVTAAGVSVHRAGSWQSLDLHLLHFCHSHDSFSSTLVFWKEMKTRAGEEGGKSLHVSELT